MILLEHKRVKCMEGVIEKPIKDGETGDGVKTMEIESS